MKYIITVLKKWIPKEIHKPLGRWNITMFYVPPLGRWNIEHCNVKMNTKIDLSNEDHCGPCGQYALTKIDLKKNEIILIETPKTEK